MKVHTGLVLSCLLSLGVLSYACANGDTVGGSTGNNSGGSNGNTGGSNSNSGGSTGHTGGTTGNTGGSTAHTGGTTGNTGGTTSNTGGTTGAGGVVATGGITGSTGGTTGGGGTTGTTCGSSFSVNATGFVSMPAQGGACWSGYAYTYVDSYGSTVMPMSPTPGFSTCGMPCNLTITGMIMAVTGTSYTYEGLGFNLGDTSTGGTTHPTVTPKGSGLTIAFANTTPSTLPLRAQISDGTNNWCYTVSGASPVTIPYGSFNTKCYDSPPDGTAYAKNPINTIQLQIAGGTTSGAVNVTISSVTENP